MILYFIDMTNHVHEI